MDDVDLHGEVVKYPEPVQQEQPYGEDHAMDSLVDDMNRIRAGPRDYDESGIGSIDSSGVPADYTAGSCADHNHQDAKDALDRAARLLAVPRIPLERGVSRHEQIDFFRVKSWTALLTRGYEGGCAEWGEYVFSISVNEG